MDEKPNNQTLSGLPSKPPHLSPPKKGGKVSAQTDSDKLLYDILYATAEKLPGILSNTDKPQPKRLKLTAIPTQPHLYQFYLLYKALEKDGWFDRTQMRFEKAYMKHPNELSEWLYGVYVRVLKQMREHSDWNERYRLYQFIRVLINDLTGKEL